MKPQEDKKMKYQFFVNKHGNLVMQPNKFKGTNIMLTCNGTVKQTDAHEFGFKIY
jgi:hypothetical protein